MCDAITAMAQHHPNLEKEVKEDQEHHDSLVKRKNMLPNLMHISTIASTQRGGPKHVAFAIALGQRFYIRTSLEVHYTLH